MQRFWLVGIVVLAFLLRTIGLSSHPTGFTTDEASYGYDAYSILKTGKDQWGEPWPLILRSSGDFKLPLYSYFTVPFVAIFGLNEFAVRLPNALFGTLAVVVTYLLVYELVQRGSSTRLTGPVGSSSRPTSSLVAAVTRRDSLRSRHPFGDRYCYSLLPFLSAFLLTISPWHISLSRGAFEMNLTTFFVPLGVWAFVKGIKQPKWMILASFAFGINLFSYHSARVFTPFLILMLMFWKRRELGNITLLYNRVKRYWVSVLVIGIFASAAFYTLFIGAGTRGADIAIFNPTDRWADVSQRRHEAVAQGLSDQLARVFNNKIVYVFDKFVGNYLSYLSPRFLFTEGVSEWTYGMISGRGVLYLVELPFLLVAFAALLKGNGFPGAIFFLAWIVLSPITASLTKGLGFAASRATVMMSAIQILSAYGLVVLWEQAGHLWGRVVQKLVLIGFLCVLVFSLIVFLEDYVYHTQLHAPSSMHYGKGEVVRYVSSLEQDYDEIVFSRSLSTPNIWVAFYNKWDPTDYQEEARDWFRYEKEGWKFLDQLDSYALGKYTFSDVDKQRDGKVLMVGKKGEFPKDVRYLKTFYYPSGEEAYFVGETISIK